MIAMPSLQNNQFSIRPLTEDIGVKMNGTEAVQILRNLAVNALQCTLQSHRVEIGGAIEDSIKGQKSIAADGLPFGPNIRIRLLAGISVFSSSARNPTVAFT